MKTILVKSKEEKLAILKVMLPFWFEINSNKIKTAEVKEAEVIGLILNDKGIKVKVIDNNVIIADALTIEKKIEGYYFVITVYKTDTYYTWND